MQYLHQHLATAVKIIEQYNGNVPLVHHLKQYFSLHKKHGSKDRKSIAQLCYSHYRLGKAFHELSIEERIKIALFLCNNEVGRWAFFFDDNWLAAWATNLHQRITFVQSCYPSFVLDDVFPWKEELSEGIDVSAFIGSHFIQPDLFLRVRPGFDGTVKQKLNERQISFEEKLPFCLALPNASKIDEILAVDKEVVIQDLSSQRVGEFFQLIQSQPGYRSALIQLWDCCAASGGKSILAKDILGNISLTVTDIRTSILKNLEQRFLRAGIKNYQSFVADISRSITTIQHEPFNIIICDAPCSGSGTWSRTPEQLSFFAKEKINEYAALQKKIVSNTIPHLAESGYFLYITCSVFAKENEEVVMFIKQQFHLELVKMELLEGYTQKAGSMFAALFKKV
ncbi:MAG: Fmu (Sun) domain-containing protein [Bacteroidota bacterium]|nr:Fmu (Sun) domain-containing protein [Bacteroidota bacterium]